MILVINATNRPNNKSQYIAKYCSEYLENVLNQKVEYYTLQDLPRDAVNIDMYDPDKMDKALLDFQDNFAIPTTKWLIIAPEYNGSFSGIFKIFVDLLSIRKRKETFSNKKVGLIGTSSGRAGNLRGLEHITSFLNYLQMTVFYNKLPISSIDKFDVIDSFDHQLADTLNAFLDDYERWLR